MFRNYIKIAWRNILKNKLFSAINIISLAIGLSASFVIGLMIYHEFSFDNFHPNQDRIYRVSTRFFGEDHSNINRGVNTPLTKVLKDDFPGVSSATSLYTYRPYEVKVGDKKYKNSEGAIFTDKNYFEIFQYLFLAGTKEALNDPNKIILSKNKAEKYFPNLSYDQVLGKIITYDDSATVEVAGIVADFSEKTDLIFDEFISLEAAKKTDMDWAVSNESWTSISSSSQLFVLLHPNTAKSELQNKLDALGKEHEDKEAAERGDHLGFNLQALPEMHFSEYGLFDYGNSAANKSVLTYLSLIALFLLLLGCINFVNLNTAAATQRAKEIGIRKTLGSSKKQLMFQFLGETFLLTLISGILSIGFGYMLYKIFAEFLSPTFHYSLILQPEIITGIMLLLLIVSALAGVYPAIILSQFKPVSILKSNIFFRKDKGELRKFLSFFQFGIAQIFIIATILVGKQIHFMLNKDLGFKSNEIAFVEFPYQDENIDKRYLLKNKLKSNPKINNLSLASAAPSSYTMYGTLITYATENGEEKTQADELFGDTNYLEIYNIPLLAGRKPINDSINEFVANQTLVKKLGYSDPKDIINQRVNIGKTPYTIVGVMQDFNQGSLRSDIRPMIFTTDINRKWRTQFSTLSFSFNPNNLNSAIADVEKQWKNIYPEADFEVQFVDKTLASFYRQEQRISKLLQWATGLSILISALGLFGLVIYTTERKTKEIGIRKILGASLLRLNANLCKDFIIPVAIAVLVAIPIAFYLIDNWLQDYAYKTEISWWVFALSAIGMLIFAVILMSFRTIQTALRNPVKSLRTE